MSDIDFITLQALIIENYRFIIWTLAHSNKKSRYGLGFGVGLLFIRTAFFTLNVMVNNLSSNKQITDLFSQSGARLNRISDAIKSTPLDGPGLSIVIPSGHRRKNSVTTPPSRIPIRVRSKFRRDMCASRLKSREPSWKTTHC